MVTAGQTIETADPSNIVIFGATGDLTKRKLIPALIRMFDCGLVHTDSRIIGVIRNQTHDEWLQIIREGLAEYSPQISMDDDKWKVFASRMKSVIGDLDNDQIYADIGSALELLGDRKNAMFYCAIPPGWYGRVAHGLDAAGLISEQDGYRRIVIEKPFGMNLESAHALNQELLAVCNEKPDISYRSLSR